MSKAQRTRVIAAFLGWLFDGFDGFLYVLVGFPVVEAIMARSAPAGAPSADIHHDASVRATIIQAAFLVGWAIGGMVFGWLGDRMGRVRALRWTIFVYAIFTGLCAFAGAWWQLLIFRFIAALGIGGEWAAGATLVAESLAPRHRAWASATLQSGYIVGCILAALVVRLMAGFEPRFVFLFGLVPAVLTVWVRRHVEESPVWKAAETALDSRLADAPKEPVWRSLVTTTLVSSIALTGAWAFLFFVGPTARQMTTALGWEHARAERLLADVTIVYFLVNIVGNFAATYLARAIGYRATFALFFLATGCTLYFGFGSTMTVPRLYLASSGFAFFGLGLFAMFPLYVPAVFPTRCRNMCSGTSYNLGRIIAAVGTLVTGWIAVQTGGPRESLWWLWTIYGAGIIVSAVIERPRHLVSPPPTHG